MTYGENRGCPGSSKDLIPDFMSSIVSSMPCFMLIPGMLGMFILGQT